MNTWKANQGKDTSRQFYSNIDRLSLLINNTVENNQIENAERYIKYFFEVMIDYLKKQSFDPAKGAAQSLNIKIVDQVNIPSTNEINVERYFKDRTLDPAYYDIFLEKTIILLSKRIEAGEHNIFHFIISLLKDSIRELIKNDKTKKSAEKLISYFKFITNLIVSEQSKFGIFQRNWYKNETYEWFIDLYSTTINKPEDIQIFEREILEILKIYIDQNDTEVYQTFLERLSTSFFSYLMYEDKLIKDFSPPDYRIKTDYDLMIFKARQNVKKLTSIPEFKKILELELSKVEDFFVENKYEQNSIKEFKEKFNFILLNDYKEEYIKIILLKSSVYALFRRKPTFFKIFLTYRNPEDSDAIWSNKYYGITSVNELFELLENADYITHDLFFWMGYHGFQVYFNTILSYYMLMVFQKDIINKINSLQDYDIASAIELSIRNIMNRYNPNLLSENLKEPKDEYTASLKKFLDAATAKREALDAQRIIKADIDPGIVVSFKKNFIESFYKFSSIRGIFDHFGLVDKKMDKESNTIYGLNELFTKKMFIQQSDTFFYNIADSIANRIAENENFNLLLEIEKFCAKKNLSKKEFEQFLLSNKSNFDIILTGERFDIKFDFETLRFVESWSTKNEFNEIADYTGILDDHYKVFYSRSEFEGYMLLNSKNLGVLEQKIPILDEKNFEQIDTFFFSVIDFKDHEAEKNTLLATKNFTEKVLMESIWLRIFESYEFKTHTDFKGLKIKIG